MLASHRAPICYRAKLWASAARTQTAAASSTSSKRSACQRFRASGVIDPAKRQALIPFPNGKVKLLGTAHGAQVRRRLRLSSSARNAASRAVLYLIDDAPLCVRCCEAINIRRASDVRLRPRSAQASRRQGARSAHRQARNQGAAQAQASAQLMGRQGARVYKSRACKTHAPQADLLRLNSSPTSKPRWQARPHQAYQATRRGADRNPGAETRSGEPTPRNPATSPGQRPNHHPQGIRQ